MDTLLHSQKISPAPDILRDGMAFLSENPEAFGLVSDACPIVTDEWMIAANGSEADVSVISCPYPAAGGIDCLYDTVFEGILPRSPMTDAILSATFGAAISGVSYPLARYAAVLTQAIAAHVLSGMPWETTPNEVAHTLGESIPRSLSGLRERLTQDGIETTDASPYSVSFAACRAKRLSADHHILDIFIAGDYRAYLLDKNGFRPLRLPPSDDISAGSPSALIQSKRVDIRHPEPFAILLLSGSACAVNAAEQQALKANPGLAWRYRMRLETNILRIITSLSADSDFGTRAGQFFTGRAYGRDSASGAMILRLDGVPFSTFRTDCLARLRHVEDMVALLPDGYDPAKVTPLPSRAENEQNYIRRLLSQEQGLPERTTDALRILALEKLTVPSDGSLPIPDDVSEWRRISREDIEEIYRIYDAENDDDYTHIEQNRDTLREHLSANWVTLRPIFARLCHDADKKVSDGDVVHASLLRLNARLSTYYDERKHCMNDVARRLEKHTAMIRESGENWLHSQDDADRAALWADTAAAELSLALHAFADTYERTEDEYRTLLADYTTERAHLFAKDADESDGFFSKDWHSLLHGQMSEERASACRAAIADATSGDTYTELWDRLFVISRGTGARIRRVQDRSADRRMARDISERAEFRIAAIRASAYRDADWGEAVCDLLDDAHRANYFTMVRRWQETRELMARQAAAYEEYRALWTES